MDEILNVVTSKEAASVETPDTINAIDIDLPVEDMKQFSQLSQTIRQDIEKEKSMVSEIEMWVSLYSIFNFGI